MQTANEFLTVSLWNFGGVDLVYILCTYSCGILNVDCVIDGYISSDVDVAQL